MSDSKPNCVVCRKRSATRVLWIACDGATPICNPCFADLEAEALRLAEKALARER